MRERSTAGMPACSASTESSSGSFKAPLSNTRSTKVADPGAAANVLRIHRSSTYPFETSSRPICSAPDNVSPANRDPRSEHASTVAGDLR